MDFTAYLKALGALLGGSAVVAVGTVVGIKWLAERWFERRFESYKAELGNLTEQLKYVLQKEMLKAQLSTSKVHEVYPRLYGKILRAHGAVAGLMGLRFASTYEGYNQQDFRKLLVRERLPFGETDRLLKVIEADRESGIEELKQVLRRVELHRGRLLVQRAKNYRILKALYLSQEVTSLADGLTTGIYNYWVDVEVGEMPDNPMPLNYRQLRKQLTELDGSLEQLKQLMRKELLPKE